MWPAHPFVSPRIWYGAVAPPRPVQNDKPRLAGAPVCRSDEALDLTR